METVEIKSAKSTNTPLRMLTEAQVRTDVLNRVNSYDNIQKMTLYVGTSISRTGGAATATRRHAAVNPGGPAP